LRKLYDLAGGRRRLAWGISLIDNIGRIGLSLLAWLRIEGDHRQPLLPAAGACRRAARALQDDNARNNEPAAITAIGAARPLADAIATTLQTVNETLAATPAKASPKESAAARSPGRLLTTDAFTNPEYVRFALKVTLAVMVCYFVMSMTNWPGIHTCVITAFFVSLGTVGDTLHKSTLRFVGCLIGAGLGLGAILLLMPLMPLMPDLGDLLLLLAPVTLLAAWVGYGSERISYGELADWARLLSCRAAGLRPDSLHVYGEGPHHRHSVRQYRGLCDIYDHLAGERGQRCSLKPCQSIGANGGAGGPRCLHRRRDFAGHTVIGRSSIWAANRAGTSSFGQRCV
jgi:Fusaric acid resistance protein family